MEIFDTLEFKEMFWDWFDNLPKAVREKFQTYPADMAELNFYNTVYRHKRDKTEDDEKSSRPRRR